MITKHRQPICPTLSKTTKSHGVLFAFEGIFFGGNKSINRIFGTSKPKQEKYQLETRKKTFKILLFSGNYVILLSLFFPPHTTKNENIFPISGFLAIAY